MRTARTEEGLKLMAEAPRGRIAALKAGLRAALRALRSQPKR